MNITVTRRDKKLLYIMLCMMIIAGGIVFLINPRLESLSAAEDMLLKERTAKFEMENAVSEMSFNKNRVIELTAMTKNRAGEYYRPMKLDDTDDIVTGSVIRSGLKPETLTMTKFKVAKIVPYVGGVDVSVKTGDSDGDVITKKLKNAGVTLSFKGEKSEFINLIDKFSANGSIIIKNFSYSEEEPEEKAGDMKVRREDSNIKFGLPEGSKIAMPEQANPEADKKTGDTVSVKLKDRTFSINIEVLTYKR